MPRARTPPVLRQSVGPEGRPQRPAGGPEHLRPRAESAHQALGARSMCGAARVITHGHAHRLVMQIM